MNRLLSLAAGMLLLTLGGSCSDDGDSGEDTGAGVRFTARFIEQLPEETLIQEYSARERAETLAAHIPCTTSEYTQEACSERDEAELESTYDLTLFPTSAHLKVTEIERATNVWNRVAYVDYTFEAGTYTVDPGADTAYEVLLQVSSNQVTIAYRSRQDGETSEAKMFLPLEEHRIVFGDIIEELRRETAAGEPSTTEMLLNAETYPNGIVALRNSDYTFNFIPATGMLTRLEPDYKEIGVLVQTE